jgi:GR25 family glycosyltransferase involved in LPS biosynthesis
MNNHDILLISVVSIVFLIAYWSVSKQHGKLIEKFKEREGGKQVSKDIQPLITRYDVVSWVINLDKNKDRWASVRKSYQQSDMTTIPLNRFSAVVGSKLNPSVYLSEEAQNELKTNEKQGFRTRHYQLSRGGIGCFLSHYEIFKKLLQMDDDMYLVFEDDVAFPKNSQEQISVALHDAPKDWDIILFGFSRLHGYKEKEKYVKAMGFWGTGAYAINRGGAMKFIKECDIHKMDAQIDAYMSYLSQTGKLNVYALADRIISTIDEGSDIQMYGVKTENDENAFLYKGLTV